MFIYEKYILRKLIAVFLLTVLFFTALLFIFNVFRIARRIESGLELALVFKLLIYLVPFLLAFSIPFGTLVACLLVYGRLSAQNELLALRTSGVSLYRACSAVAMLAVGTLLLSLFVFGVISPKGQFAARKELENINPLFFFEPGETIKVSGYSIYLKKREHSRLDDIVIHRVDEKDVTTRIHAKTGLLTRDEESGVILLRLYDVHTIMWEPGGQRLWEERDKTIEIEFDLAAIVEKARARKRESDMTFRELLARARLAGETGEDVSEYVTGFNKRLVFSFACLSFAMIGAPLGIRVRRGEKTVGISIGLGLAMSFYTMVMFAEKLSNKPSLHPQLLMWIPNALLLILGMLFFRSIRRGGG